MLTPQFPYKGNQIIISSGRVIVHAKDDAVFILGKQAVGISSPKTINLDSNEKILLNCSKIELGYKAETQGEPITLGKTFTRELNRVMTQLYDVAVLLSQVSESDVATSMFYISTAGAALADQVAIFQNVLTNEDALSDNTFTR
jgi:hypothetical protein